MFSAFRPTVGVTEVLLLLCSPKGAQPESCSVPATATVKEVDVPVPEVFHHTVLVEIPK